MKYVKIEVFNPLDERLCVVLGSLVSLSRILHFCYHGYYVVCSCCRSGTDEYSVDIERAIRLICDDQSLNIV